ncbi:hypothetical protein Q0590_12040 [Rhodocytophaga aerolata]|uniref:Uncharacterized protein n=1 Tax=Rhodocytophaga aerolata TaxID=455078 RepID=A0ABT8R4Y0_9BACT|nr:hypothetical protein [Rhodocytophaga aerolata]MDO1446989.1 hypothetical protein [Rhodocytophaga aerolata]
MITYFQFLLLSLQQKKQYLTEKATFLLSYTTHANELHLYAVNDFFVEMHLNEQKQVTEIISFKGLNRLEQHIEQVSLAQLHGLGVIGGHSEK